MKNLRPNTVTRVIKLTCSRAWL